MTATLARPSTRRTAPAAAPTPLPTAYRFELAKLMSQWRSRLLLLTCWLAPAAIVAVVGQQSSLPADTVFGRWMSQTGWAGPLVVLAFAGSWVLPLLTSLVAGDVFAAEDRLGTWRHLLVAVRSPQRIFAAKALASLTVIVALVLGLTVSGVVGGLLAIGDHPLVGLDGHPFASGDAAVRVLLAWACALAPTLAFAAVGLLGSVLFGRSPMGLVTPALLALLLDAAQLLPLPAALRVALPSYAFLAWRGLFTDPAQTSSVVVGVVVSLVWAVAATALAYRVFARRDFTELTHDGSGRRSFTAAVLPLTALLALTVAVVAPPRPPPARASPGRNSTVRSRRPTATSTASSRATCTARRSPRRSCTPAPPATRAAHCRRRRSRQRLALRRHVAHPRGHGHRAGDLPARRHPRWPLRRRR